MAANTEEYQINKLKLQFGQDFDTNGKINANFFATFNKEIYQNAKNELNQLSGNQLNDLDDSLVLTFHNANIEKLQHFLEYLNQDSSILKGIKISSHFDEKTSTFFAKMPIVQSETVNFSLIPHKIGQAWLNWENKTNSGLSEQSQQLIEILKDKNDQIEGSFQLNLTPLDISNNINNNGDFFVMLFSQLKVELKLQIESILQEKLEEFLSFPKLIKNVDLDVKFDSFEQLPEPIKKLLKAEKLDQKLNQEKYQPLIILLEGLGSKVELSIFWKSAGLLKVEGQADGLTCLLLNHFGGYL